MGGGEGWRRRRGERNKLDISFGLDRQISYIGPNSYLAINPPASSIPDVLEAPGNHHLQLVLGHELMVLPGVADGMPSRTKVITSLHVWRMLRKSIEGKRFEDSSIERHERQWRMPRSHASD